ncbi:unnamed protein product [Heterobilharzia americana]|nr:unnamed protein product [Heterobilharzia americana]
MMLAFRWASVFCKQKTSLLLFIDNDYILHPNNTINLVKSIGQWNMKSFAGGSLHKTSIVVRPSGYEYSSRWAISSEEYPWDYYPPYFFGVGYILSPDLVQDASVVMSFIQNIRFDDVSRYCISKIKQNPYQPSGIQSCYRQRF